LGKAKWGAQNARGFAETQQQERRRRAPRLTALRRKGQDFKTQEVKR
jgi:hypothetical protein